MWPPSSAVFLTYSWCVYSSVTKWIEFNEGSIMSSKEEKGELLKTQKVVQFEPSPKWMLPAVWKDACVITSCMGSKGILHVTPQRAKVKQNWGRVGNCFKVWTKGDNFSRDFPMAIDTFSDTGLEKAKRCWELTASLESSKQKLRVGKMEERYEATCEPSLPERRR